MKIVMDLSNKQRDWLCEIIKDERNRLVEKANKMEFGKGTIDRTYYESLNHFLNELGAE